MFLKIPLGSPVRRLEDNIRMHLKEIRVNTRNWVGSAQDRDCECGIEPPGSINYGFS